MTLSVPVETIGARIRHVRERAELTQAEFGQALDVSRGAVGNWELDKGIKLENLRAIAQIFRVPLGWLSDGAGEVPQIAIPPPAPNASVAQPAGYGDFRIPAYGQAVAGENGRFILNGNKIADILAPHSLAGVRDAYAVYVAGESMEPRYHAGEVVFVNPRLPIRSGDYVVIQIQAELEGEPPNGYVKRYLRTARGQVLLEQYNPARQLSFPAETMVSIHRIVMGGEG